MEDFVFQGIVTIDLKAVVDATMERVVDAIQEKESKRPIGFSIGQMKSSESDETEIAASTITSN